MADTSDSFFATSTGAAAAEASSSASSLNGADDAGSAIPGHNVAMTRWLNLVLVVLRQLLQTEEDVVLSRMKVYLSDERVILV